MPYHRRDDISCWSCRKDGTNDCPNGHHSGNYFNGQDWCHAWAPIRREETREESAE